MRIVVVHQHYLVAGQPGGSRFNEFARLWAEAGHDVTVVAGTVNYATGAIPERYHGRWVTEEWDGKVRVLRCHVPATYSKSYLGRAFAFGAFAISASSAALFIRQADVVIATSPPLVSVLPGAIIARLRRPSVPWIFEVRDLWPESAVTTGVLRADGAITRALYAVEAWAYRHSTKINVLTPAFRDDILGRGLAEPAKILFVPNGADLDLFTPGPRDNAERRRRGWGDDWVALYAGAHGRANALAQLVDAAEQLRDTPRIRIVCVGDGPERASLIEAARRRGLNNVEFIGPVPKDEMPALIQACDVGLAVLQDNPTFRTVYPNKVFDYMACERACLVAIDGVARKLVCDEARAGEFARPEDGKDIATVLRRMFSDPGHCRELGVSGRAWVVANASREGLASRYLEAMRLLVEGP